MAERVDRVAFRSISERVGRVALNTFKAAGAPPRCCYLSAAFKWVNTMLVNIKTAIGVNCKTVRKKHVGRSFAGFE